MKILKFQADWCIPCRNLSKAMNGVDFGVPVESINIETQEALVTIYDIRSVPTLVIVEEDGIEINRLVGAITVQKIREALDGI